MQHRFVGALFLQLADIGRAIDRAEFRMITSLRRLVGIDVNR